MLMCLALCFSGCADKPCPPCRPAAPPAAYLGTVPEPKMRGRTNNDLLAWALDLRQALRLANSDKAALQEWATAQTAATDPAP